MQLPESINIHITNVCNYKCKFCYYQKFDKKKWLETPVFINILKQLKYTPVKKINLAGGEPLLHPNINNLLQIMREMGFISSIITNGSKLNTQWLNCNGNNIDLIGISCDSALESLEKRVGRGNGKHVASVINVFKEIHKYNATHNNRIFTKLNTVVTQLNVHENMGALLQFLRPDRWKILQILKINGQNEKEFYQLRISEQEFNDFIEKHHWISKKGIVMVPESNELETNSYLMINHDGRLFQNNNGKYHTSSPIHKIGLKQAITQVVFSYSKYIERGGSYEIVARN